MEPTWQEVKNKVKAYRDYVETLTPAGQTAAKHAFMITKEEIKSMLEQAGGAQQLDGLRAYIGADMVNGEMVPCLFFVAVKKEGTDTFNDYLLTQTLPAGAQPLLAKTKPCPVWCGTTANFLNS